MGLFSGPPRRGLPIRADLPLESAFEKVHGSGVAELVAPGKVGTAQRDEA
jgi:hypothetical protein